MGIELRKSLITCLWEIDCQLIGCIAKYEHIAVGLANGNKQNTFFKIQIGCLKKPTTKYTKKHSEHCVTFVYFVVKIY